MKTDPYTPEALNGCTARPVWESPAENDTDEEMRKEMEQEHGNRFWDKHDEDERAGWEDNLTKSFDE